MQGLGGVSSLQPAGALPAVQAGARPVPEQRLGECGLGHGDVGRGGQELRSADCQASQAIFSMPGAGRIGSFRKGVRCGRYLGQLTGRSHTTSYLVTPLRLQLNEICVTKQMSAVP